jgi:hypothetical protein
LMIQKKESNINSRRYKIYNKYYNKRNNCINNYLKKIKI